MNMQSSKPITVAILRSGLLPDSVLNEMQHWGLPVSFAQQEKVPVLDTAEEVIECIREAIEDGTSVEIRDTDLDVLSTYLRRHFSGHLVLLDPDTNKTKRAACTYAVLPNGRYIIPWTAEYIGDVLVDPKSFLRIVDGKHVAFDDVAELFFGGRKAFISARPVVAEES